MSIIYGLSPTVYHTYKWFFKIIQTHLKMVSKGPRGPVFPEIREFHILATSFAIYQLQDKCS